MVKVKNILETKKNQGLNFLTVKEAAKFLNYDVGYMYQLVHKNKLSYYKPSGKIYFLQSDLEEYILRSKVSCTHDLDKVSLSYLKKGML